MAVSLISILLLSNCSIEVEDDEKTNENYYSRDNFNDEAGSLMGYGTLDDENTSCYYVYNSDKFRNMYGNNFEINYAQGVADLETLLFWTKGTSNCYVYIDKDIWCFDLKKEFFSKWEIVDYYQCETDTDGTVIQDENGNVIKK